MNESENEEALKRLQEAQEPLEMKNAAPINPVQKASPKIDADKEYEEDTHEQGKGTYSATKSSNGVRRTVRGEKPDKEDSGSGKGKIIIFAFLGLVVIFIVCWVVYSIKNKSSNSDTQSAIEQPVTSTENQLSFETNDYSDGYYEESVDVSFYSSEQIEQLRSFGYTGTEIEQYATEEKSFYELKQEAEDARKEWLNAAIEPFMDTASDEFKYAYNSTWLNLQPVDMNAIQSTYGFYENTENLTYEKIPLYGHQLYIRVFLNPEKTDWFLLEITPERYHELADQGNIVVTYGYNTVAITNEDGSISEDVNSKIIIYANEELVEQTQTPGGDSDNGSDDSGDTTGDALIFD